MILVQPRDGNELAYATPFWKMLTQLVEQSFIVPGSMFAPVPDRFGMGPKPQHVEIVQIGADNDRMLRELRDLSIDFYKTHRMYQRGL
jgi:hypothetical protein